MWCSHILRGEKEGCEVGPPEVVSLLEESIEKNTIRDLTVRLMRLGLAMDVTKMMMRMMEKLFYFFFLLS